MSVNPGGSTVIGELVPAPGPNKILWPLTLVILQYVTVAYAGNRNPAYCYGTSAFMNDGATSFDWAVFNTVPELITNSLFKSNLPFDNVAVVDQPMSWTRVGTMPGGGAPSNHWTVTVNYYVVDVLT